MRRQQRLASGGGARRGFTMVEIILVVMIIMTLAAVIGPRLVGRAKQAKIQATKIQMGQIKTTLGQYEVKIGSFPTTEQGLEALIKCPSDVEKDEWGEKYMDDLPKDAWKKPFQYKCPSEHGKDYDLVSSGPDKRFGTADDITNYEDESSNTASK